jgi:uncharacterized OB-fold protein
MEKIAKATEAKHWSGHMEVDHFHYTAGLAGELFFTALRDEGKILGSRCPRCGLTYVPPRIYCERCFDELDQFIDVGLRGRVRTFTVARIDEGSNRLNSPEIRALISFGDDTTDLLHRLGEVEVEDLFIGMEVEAVLKPGEEREGKITDILYFNPAT